MVPNRRLEYGFRGYQVPATPRAPRSVRRRGSISKKVEDDKLQAFDLLAAVAGELLLEKDEFPPLSDSSSQKEQEMINAESHQLEQSAEVDCRSIEHKLLTGHGPDFKVEDDLKETKLLNCKLDDDDDEVKIENRDQKLVSVPRSVEDTVVCSENPTSSECSVPCNSFPLSGKDAKVVCRDDDDENLYAVNTVKKPPFTTSAPRFGDRRIRKILASKYRKLASRVKDEPFTRNDGDVRSSYWARKNCYRHQRNQRIYPFKKRRLYDMNSISKYDKKINSVDGVKLRIKSFRIPELFIEIPETATVGSLKRMVMEAVGALFGGGLHVGVLLRGKKVRDDSKTLQQTGITHENHQDSLGFTLEPNPSLAAPIAPQAAAPSIVHHVEPKPLARCLPESSIVPYRALDTPTKPQGTKLPEIDSDSVHSSDTTTIDCKALVPHPAINKETLSMVPARFKPKHRPDIGQRRIRRPFTVTEVEALVQAVENLGTGRWRDVKIQAFNDAEHRTYVDLKDKWKTLVHTARIAPQQRRGEPVPQQLLDRVLAAQAFWAPQQTKQHLPGTPTSSSALKELSC